VTGLQWVVDAYTLTFAAMILTAGALGDRCGARRTQLGGFTVFTLASIACGLAPAIGVLIAARAVQGVGAGGAGGRAGSRTAADRRGGLAIDLLHQRAAGRGRLVAHRAVCSGDGTGPPSPGSPRWSARRSKRVRRGSARRS
jgi:MFS family permease